MIKRARNPEFEQPGAENLNEQDRKLNLLGTQFERVAHNLNTNSIRMIKMADSEIPDEHSEVNTDVLSQVKDQLKALTQLVQEIEQAQGIIDARPERKLLESTEPIDARLPGGGSLFERLLDYARGAMTQRPDHFDPETKQWSDSGKEKMKHVYSVGATPEQFDRILERVEQELKRE